MTAPALVLERAMLDPRWPDLVTKLRALTPQHLLDQADAAVASTDDLTHLLAKLMHTDGTGAAPVDDIPGWLRLSALHAFTSWIDGTAATCLHSPSPQRPQPVIAAAWKPGLVTCGRCVALFATRRGSAFDRTCDGCGRVCGGLEVDDGIYPGVVRVAVMIFQYGTCSDCHTPPAAPLPSPVMRAAAPPGQRTKPRGTRGRARGLGRP